METSSVMVCIRMNSSFLLAHFMTFYVANISKLCVLTPIFKTIFCIITLCLNSMKNLNAFSMAEVFSSVCL